MANKWLANEEIKIFREYLQIPTVHPDIDFVPCVDFLRKQAASLNLEFKVCVPVDPKWPVVIMTWRGTDPELPSIMLLSHMDVVPVFEELWTYPPFAAEIDEEGRIFARGTQDMKSVGMQYLAAIRALKRDGVQLKRTLHAVFVPDEETTGECGTAPFVHHQDFKDLNVGFGLDEGVASPTDDFLVFYGERSNWKITFKCSGTTGHGSMMFKDTAGEKLSYVISKFMAFRQAEIQKLANNPEWEIGNVTSVNLTMVEGGVQMNVVPPVLSATFDVRISCDVDHVEFEDMLNRWCEEAGGGIEMEFPMKLPRVAATRLDDSNPYWLALRKAISEDLKLKYKTRIFVANTDSWYLRELNIPAIGFSPIINTPILFHDHDEYLSADIYLRGIDIYKQILTSVGNV